MDLLMTSRDKWGAEPAKVKTEDIELPIKHVFHIDIPVIRCRDATSCESRMREIQNREINSVGHRDLGYNFVVGGNGMMYEGRGWTKRAILPTRFLDKINHSIVIGYIGKASPAGVPEWMKGAVDNFIKKAITLGYVDNDYESVELFQKPQDVE